MLLFILSILGGAAIWYYRIKRISEAGAEIADAVSTARGKYRRGKMRKQAAESPVAAIDSPIVAAATLLRLLIKSDTLAAQQQLVLQKLLEEIASQEMIDEAMIYSDWVYSQGHATGRSIDLICEQLHDWLDEEERIELITMIDTLRSSDLFAVSEQLGRRAISQL